MSSDDDADDGVFRALGNRVRRQMLDALRVEPLTTGALCAEFPQLDRCTVMQHLKVLEEAGLVVARREGRERWNHLNAVPIQRLHERWIGSYALHGAGMLSRLERELAG